MLCINIKNMALSDKKILESMKSGDIIITPFNKENLATSSYDLTLGEYYFTEQPPKHFQNIFNIYEKEHIDRIWGTKPSKAKLAKDVFANYKFTFGNIAPNDKVILLAPGETILAHTNEFIGGQNHITTMMKARSSLGRSFIEICKCAGWGDVGYINRWTMEVNNLNENEYVPLPIYYRMAQIVFSATGPVATEYAKSTGKYQSVTSDHYEDLARDWEPSAMLPRSPKDVPDLEAHRQELLSRLAA